MCRQLLLLLLMAEVYSKGEDDIISALHSKMISSPSETWPGGKVYYALAEGEFSRIQDAVLHRYIRRLENLSCVRFLPRKRSDKAYIRFRNIKRRCAAHIGYKPNEVRDLFVGWPDCYVSGVIMHEILHGLGMWHEHSRQDRDQHLTVFWENISRGRELNFKLSPGDRLLSLPYDYGSVMHYTAWAFSKTGKEITLLPKEPTAVDLIGQRKGISLVDIAKLNTLYNCSTPYYRGEDLNGISYVNKLTSTKKYEIHLQRFKFNKLITNNAT